MSPKFLTSPKFLCFVENVVQANILAACAKDPVALNQVYNIALGERTTLNELFHLIRNNVAGLSSGPIQAHPAYRDFRPGDIRHSHADIGKAKRLLGYEPGYAVRDGLEKAGEWYARHLD